MVIWNKFTHSHPFSSLIPKLFYFYCLLLDRIQISLIHGPNIPGSYALLFFAASDFTFIIRHFHIWASFLLWPSCFLLSGAISSYSLLFPSSILDTFWSGGHIFQYQLFFLSFCTVHEVLTASTLGWFANPFSSGSHFVRTLCYDLSILGHPTWHGPLRHWVMQAPLPQQGSDLWSEIASPTSFTYFILFNYTFLIYA